MKEDTEEGMSLRASGAGTGGGLGTAWGGRWSDDLIAAL